MKPDEAVAALAAIVGTEHVVTDPAQLAPNLSDWRGRYHGRALCKVSPADTAQVAAVVRLCAAADLKLVPQGGNTGLCGGAIPAGPDQVLISLGRLRRIRAITADTITVEAGCTLAEVQQAARAAGKLFPLSLAAEGTASIGGNLATNAGGVQVLRYGNARELCLGLEVVLADGRVWDGLRALRKDNTGYDLKQLFIGSEGTLGIITAAVLKLFPAAKSRVTAWVAVCDPAAAVALLDRLRAQCDERVTAFELIGRTALDLVLAHIPDSREPLAGRPAWSVLCELSDSSSEAGLEGCVEQVLADALADGEVLDATLAASAAQAAAFWRLRETIPEAQRIEGPSIKHDIAVPVASIAAFLARCDAALQAAFPGLRIACFGHIGDGNLHYNPSQPAKAANEALMADAEAVHRIVYDLVHAFDGSISAEHGVGQLRRAEIVRYKSPVEIELMRVVKQALDPANRLNPGKVV